jgi:putative membrane protein
VFASYGIDALGYGPHITPGMLAHITKPLSNPGRPRIGKERCPEGRRKGIQERADPTMRHFRHLHGMNLLIKLVVSTIAVLVADLVLRGVSLGDMDTTQGLITALLTAVVLGLLNNLLKPLLVLLTLPATVITLGLFVLVINAVIVLIAARIVPGFVVEGFWWALGFSLLVSIVQGVLNGMDRPRTA